MISKKEAQEALKRSLSGLQNNPYLIQQITSRTNNTKNYHGKKISSPIIIAFILVGLMASAVAAGIVTTGKPWGVIDWIVSAQPAQKESGEEKASRQTISPERNSDTAQYSVIPFGQEEREITSASIVTAVSSGECELKYATLSIREAVTDGYGIYLSVSAIPSSPDILLLNWNIDPFESSPEMINQIPDNPGQTLAEWAVNHGYHKLVRLSFLSPIPNPYTHGRKISSQTMDSDSTTQEEQTDQIDSVVLDPVSLGSNFDSFVNAQMVLEEAGTSLIMIAGGFTNQKTFDISFSLIPWRMTSDGKKDPLVLERDSSPDPKTPIYDMENLERGELSFSFSDNPDADAVILAEYHGEMPLMADPNESAQIHVRFFRTALNDYCLVRYNDPDRANQNVLVYLDEEQSQFLVYSKLFVSCYQSDGKEIAFLRSCIFPDEFPSQISLRWFNDFFEGIKQTAVIYK